jgi:transcriptional regulator with XRE-family HTH domain
MAKIIGVSPTTVAQTCNGERATNLAMLAYYCAVEGHDAHRLLFGHGFEQPPETVATLLPKILDLPMADRLAVLAAVANSVQGGCGCQCPDASIPFSELAPSFEEQDSN